jgi:hypothetical protein
VALCTGPDRLERGEMGARQPRSLSIRPTLIFRETLHDVVQCHIVDRKMGSSKREFYPEKTGRLK